LIQESVSFVIGVHFVGCFSPLVGVNVHCSAAFLGVITGLLLSVSFEFANLYFDLGEFSHESLLINICKSCGTPLELDLGAGFILYF